MDDDRSTPNWRALLAALIVVMALSVAGLAFLGTHTSRILSTVGAAVGAPGGGEAVAPNDEPGEADQPGEAEPGAARAANNGSGANGIAALQDVTRPDLQLIRTGSITIEVQDITAALDQARAAVGALGGYESGSERSGQGEQAAAQVVYRVPASTWDEAVAAIRDIGENVRAEHSETEDVTSEVVDIEARIRNLRVTEAAFQSIMNRAAAIKDVLSVQGELTRVRSEIEQLSAKVAQLGEQAAMSTLTVSFALPETPVIARQEARFDPGRETEAATARLVGIVQSLATAGIWFGIVWLPMLAAVGIVLAIGYLVARWLRRARADVAISG